jgi:hypothetical protein
MATVVDPQHKGALAVNRQQFCDGLKLLLKAQAFTGHPAQFTFSGGRLHVALLGASFTAEASGHWIGEVLVDDQLLSRAAQVSWPEQPSLQISTDGRRLRIESLVLACTWNGLEYPRIPLAINCSLLEILRLPREYSPADIARSGLTERLAAAEAERERLIGLAAEHIRRAEEALVPLGLKSGCLGIDADLLRSKVEQRLQCSK